MDEVVSMLHHGQYDDSDSTLRANTDACPHHTPCKPIAACSHCRQLGKLMMINIDVTFFFSPFAPKGPWPSSREPCRVLSELSPSLCFLRIGLAQGADGMCVLPTCLIL